MITSPSSPHYSPTTNIILITPPPVNTYQRGGDLQSRNPPQLLDRSFEQTRKYAEAVREVGKQENIPVLDVWSALYDAAGRDERALEQFLWDGLHLNSAGYEVRSLFSGRRLPLSDSRDLFCLCRSCTKASSIPLRINIPSFTTTNCNRSFLRKR